MMAAAIMKTMIISEFKAKCIAAVKSVERKKTPILLTVRGRPVAEVHPVIKDEGKRILGSQAGSAIKKDIPIHEDWSHEWSN